MTFLERVSPSDWKQPVGYSNGVLVPPGARLLFVAGQIAWNERQELVGGDDFVEQFRCALANVLTVVCTAGGAPEHLVRMTVYVTDKLAYLAATRALGAIWKERVGATWPAMTLVEVSDLLEAGALVELEATAALPASPESGDTPTS